MDNNLLRPKKNIVSAPVGEENITHGWAGGILFILSMCLSLIKTIYHFGNFVRRPKGSRKLNTKLGTFSKLSYESCC